MGRAGASRTKRTGTQWPETAARRVAGRPMPGEVRGIWSRPQRNIAMYRSRTTDARKSNGFAKFVLSCTVDHNVSIATNCRSRASRRLAQMH